MRNLRPTLRLVFLMTCSGCDGADNDASSDAGRVRDAAVIDAARDAGKQAALDAGSPECVPSANVSSIGFSGFD